MVMKYIILADSSVGFETPRQLSVINGEPLIQRTIRLLKENGINDIIITSHDKRFDNLGAKRYEPLYNEYDPINNTGYWLNAFPIELLKEPICFLYGDVYYSENAIKTIVKSKTDSVLFLCSYENKSKLYIKEHDEPLAFKVVDYELFKEHIKIVKEMKDKGLCCREPINWELYRSINGQDINVHEMTGNYIAINDESCDIDTIDDIKSLKQKLGGNDMIKVEVIEGFTLKDFNLLKNIERKGSNKPGELFVGDTFECDEKMAKYLTGDNTQKKVVVKVIEVAPVKEEKAEEVKEEPKKVVNATEEAKSKKSKKKKSKK